MAGSIALLQYLGIFIAVLAAITVAGYLRVWTWTGLVQTPDSAKSNTKTLWDWLQLLIVPLVLAAGAYGINSAQTSRDRTREDERAVQQDRIAAEGRREEALRAYLQQMSGLIADHDLQSDKDSSLSALASTLTLTVLRQLDGERKGVVVQFVVDAGLMSNASGKGKSVLDLYRANMRGAKLAGAFLDNVEFGGVDLRGADLHGAIIDGTDFSDSNLRGVDLSDAGPSDTGKPVFDSTCLTGARFSGANLEGASFKLAEGRDVGFSEAFLDDADFTDARLTEIRGRAATINDRTRQSISKDWGLQGLKLRGLQLTAKERAGLCKDFVEAP
ncbi:MAG: pentapeptide repeat-containing protein [Solirubrobacteraceae bacterium]